MRKIIVCFIIAYCAVLDVAQCGSCVPIADAKTGEISLNVLTAGTEKKYLICGGSRQESCKVGALSFGVDGEVYVCTNTKWEKIEQANISDCVTNRDRPDGVGTSNEAKIQNKDYIFFADEVSTYHANIKVCKYDRKKYEADEYQCHSMGGAFNVDSETSCDTDNAKQMTVSVTDENDKPLEGVSFTLTNVEGNGNIATSTGGGYYKLLVNTKSTSDKIKISKSGYNSYDTNAKVLYNNGQEQTIRLRSVNATTGSGEGVKYAVDNGECKKSGGEWDEKSGKCICDKETKHLETTTGKSGDKLYSICKCIAGYKRKNGQYTDECVDAGETETEEVLDTAAMQKQAEEAYQAARDHEQSWANKGLTAASTLATGAGTMTALQAYAEQQADADAERDMAAYLATFKCEYGDGKTFNAGNEEITLPGGNELLGYYSEYKSLADNVKQTKTALGLRPGIESEVLYDRAQSGLYQYTNAARQSGGEISLARALADSDSVDAEKWNAQKEQTAQNLKTGAIAAAGGITAGIVGNQIINGKYEPKKLETAFKDISKRLERDYSQTFTPAPIEIKQVSPTIQTQNPQKTPQKKLRLELPSVAGTAFDSGDYELNEDGKKGLDNAIKQIEKAMNEFPNSMISIQTIGHTDMQGISLQTQKSKGYKTNQELSEKRSRAVTDYLQNGLKTLGERVKFLLASGKGYEWCEQNNKSKDSVDCRRVDINIYDLTLYEQ